MALQNVQYTPQQLGIMANLILMYPKTHNFKIPKT